MASNPNPLYSRAMVEEVLRLTNVIDVVTPHTELRPQGNGEWSGLCPFHKEKTPSFYVNESKGVYLCYGCQKKGNSITFLKEMEGLTFSEAMNRLRRSAGLPELVQSNRQMEDISVTVRSVGRMTSYEQQSWESDPNVAGYPLGELMFKVADAGRYVVERTGSEHFDEVEEIYRSMDDAILAESWGSLETLWDSFTKDLREVGDDYA